MFRKLWLLAAAGVLAICLMVWGGDLLIASEPLPDHVDAAIVLQGSTVGEKARIEGALNLLRRGVVGRVLLSVPKESYWGQSIPPVARAYLERNYGSDLAALVDFCETSGDVNSTWQEARAVLPCIREHHWQFVMIVTSNYHTRRARMIWAHLIKRDSNIRICTRAVPDPEFQQPWWWYRQSAKIWVMEAAKLVWTTLGGR
ncbi:MAG: YdcF family protein [Candidatus Sulfotelmatobacter sp.]